MYWYLENNRNFHMLLSYHRNLWSVWLFFCRNRTSLILLLKWKFVWNWVCLCVVSSIPYFMEHCTPQMYMSHKTPSYVDIGGGGYSTMGFSMLTMESIESIVFNEFHTLENVGLDINMLSIESFFFSNDTKHPVMNTVVMVDCCIEILPFLSLSVILYIKKWVHS